MNRYPWLLIVLCLALTALTVATGCAPPPPVTGNYYDDTNDKIVASVYELAAWDLAYPGMGEWIPAHEQGHQRVMTLFHSTGRALWTEMPGTTAGVQMEQVAQCEAEATLQHDPPWTNETLGWWDCPADLVDLVKSA